MPSVKRQYLQRLSGAGCLGLFALVLAAVVIWFWIRVQLLPEFVSGIVVGDA